VPIDRRGFQYLGELPLPAALSSSFCRIVLIIGLVKDWTWRLLTIRPDLAAQNVISCLWKTASR
jgi:hypothetical protein